MFPIRFALCMVAVFSAAYANITIETIENLNTGKCAISNLKDIVANVQQKCQLQIPNGEDMAGIMIAVQSALSCIKTAYGVDLSTIFNKEDLLKLMVDVKFVDPQTKVDLENELEGCLGEGPVGALEMVACILPKVGKICNLPLNFLQ